MRILYITPYVPSPIRIRPFNFIKGLAKLGHAVTLLALAPGDEAKQAPGVRPYCHELKIVPLTSRQILGNMLGNLLKPIPFQAAYGCSPQMQELIDRALKGGEFDVIHLEHLRASLFGRAISGLPKVYDSVDCISLLFERASESSPQIATRLMAKLDLSRTRRYEGRLGRLYDRILVTSEEDREALQALIAQRDTAHLHRKLVVLSNAVDLSYFAPLDAPRDSETLISTGKMSYHANVASVLYLGREVMPIIWRDRPQVKLWVVGKDPPSAIRALAADDRVTVTGYVPDLRPYLAQATVAVNPIPYSVGIQNKVLESMAMGTPVVTSPRACIALGVSPEKHLLVAHSTSTFAQQVSRLLDDSELRQRVGAAGRRYVEQNHSLARIATRLVSIYQGVIEGFGQGE